MALDERFDLRSVVPAPAGAAELRALDGAAQGLAGHPSLVESGLGGPLARLAGGIGPGDAAFYFPAMPASEAARALRTLRLAHGNLYLALAPLGVVTVNPARASPAGLVLAGGSYSTVTLSCKGGVGVVRKRVRVGSGDDVDREVRHYREAAWLAALPPEAAGMFPRLLSVVSNSKEIGADSEFIPGHTLSEMVFQDLLSGEALASQLIKVYTEVTARLYTRPPVRHLLPSYSETYPEIIERRHAAIAASGHPQRMPVLRLLRADRIRVNGQRVPSVHSVLAAARGDRRWEPVVKPKGACLAHGDMILDDIIVEARGILGFRLVDPNPANGHPMFDVCKTLLSLWLGYEFVHYSMFDVDVRPGRDGALDVELGFARPECWDRYAQAADLFVEYVREEMAPRLSLPANDLEPALRLGAALHALAIPMFHLLSRGRGDAAAAFVALGLQNAGRALGA